MWPILPGPTSSIPPVSTPFRRTTPAFSATRKGSRSRTRFEGKYYDWPVGFHVGEKLQDHWKLEEHKLGETTFTHFADGTAHKNRMQGNDFVQSVMYTRGVKCSSCHDVHGTDNDALLIKPANVMCLECHGPGSPNGPHVQHHRRTHAPQSWQRRR